ncbi:MAG TPA: carboxypeptidase-like regulatory domain-containing protein [Gemmataceae bacterium]
MFARLSPTANRLLWAGALSACFALLLFAGCTPDHRARGVVKGKVTKGNKPLPTGTVMFYGKNGVTATAIIDSDGNYTMPDAPLGECTVTVTVMQMPQDPSIRAKMRGGGPKLPEGPKDPNDPGAPDLPSGAKWPKEIVPIDVKYSNPETSGLKFTVEQGEQTYNIEL